MKIQKESEVASSLQELNFMIYVHSSVPRYVVLKPLNFGEHCYQSHTTKNPSRIQLSMATGYRVFLQY